MTEAVLDECLVGNGVDSHRIKAAIEQGWIKSVANPELLTAYSRSLGIGEKTSMEFALSLNEPVLLIMDDRLARRKARCLNLEVVGTAMLLYKAQSLGYLANADEQVLLLRQLGYRISDAVIAVVKGL